jgi:hypothetical protein
MRNELALTDGKLGIAKIVKQRKFAIQAAKAI